MITLSLKKRSDAVPIVPEGEVTTTNSWPMTDEFFLYNEAIPVVSKDGIIWVPQRFIEDGTDWDNWLPQLAEWAESGRNATQADKWLVGSARLAIDGSERQASSHKLGTAVDMTPMWNENQIVDPDGACPALAWNLLHLVGLAHYRSNTLAWAVEGDHVHFSNCGKPGLKDDGVVAIATTLSPAYPLAEYVNGELFSALMNKGFVFDTRGEAVLYAPLDSLDELLEYLGDL